MAAAITINGTPTKDIALVLGTSCPVTENGGLAGGWTWTFVSVPEGSALTVLVNPTLQSASFTPDVTGSYNVKCVTDIDGEATAIGAVLTSAYGMRLPAAHETTEFGVDGWSPSANAALQALDDGDKQFMHVKSYTTGLVAGTMYYLETSTSDLPYAVKSTAASTTQLATNKPVGIGTYLLGNYKPGHIMTRGLYVDFWVGAVAGQPIFCDEATGLLTITPSAWPVGIILSTTEVWLNFDNAHQYTYREKFIPIADFDDGINPPDSEETIIDGFGAVRIRKFSAVTDEDLSIVLTIPDLVMREGGLRYQVVGYISNTAPTTTRHVVFQAGAYTIGIGEPINGTYSADIESQAYMDAGYLQYDAWKSDLSDVITPTGNLTPGEDLNFGIRRDHAHTDDTYTQDIGVKGVKLFWIEKI